MKLTEIIRKGTAIQNGHSTFLIAEKDFIYQGLPILKNSLVYYDGKGKVSVNMIGFGIFQESNIPELLAGKLPEDDEFHYLVDKCCNCDFEIVKLESGWRGIWHENHFDNWSGSFSDYIERIYQSPVLEFSGIHFSSLMYHYNTLTNSLDHFINTKPIKLEIGDKLIELSELLEISQNGASYDIIPVSKTLEYHNIILEGNLFLSEDGILSGRSAKEFDAEIFGHDELKKITIPKNFRVYISSNGDAEIGLLNEKHHKKEKFKIRKYQ